MASGTNPNWIEAIRAAEQLTWAERLPDELDSLVLALGCTLTADERRLAPPSISSTEQGARTYRDRVDAGERTGLVAVGHGYFDSAGRDDFYESVLMRDYILAHPEIAGEIPAEDIYMEPHSYNTLVNALDVGIPIRGRQIGTIYLASDPLHAKRALATFRGVFGCLGIQSPIVGVPGAMPQYGDSCKWFLRSAVAFRAWNLVGLTLLPRHLKAIEAALGSVREIKEGTD